MGKIDRYRNAWVLVIFSEISSLNIIWLQIERENWLCEILGAILFVWHGAWMSDKKVPVTVWELLIKLTDLVKEALCPSVEPWQTTDSVDVNIEKSINMGWISNCLFNPVGVIHGQYQN